jgi:HEAT repeat protein
MGLFSRKPNVDELAAKKDVKGLIEALEHKEPRVREQAALALGEIGHASSVEPLLRAKKDKESIVRTAAIMALAKITQEEKPDIRRLLEALKHEEPSVREQAIRTLGEMGRPEAIMPITLALKDKDSLVRVAAAEAMGKILGAPESETEDLKEKLKKNPPGQ